MSKKAEIYRHYLSQLETPKAHREHSGFNLEAPRKAPHFFSPVRPGTAARWSLLLVVSFLACCYSLRADPDPATIASVSSTKADGACGSGVLIPITVTFSVAVNVTGTPALA